tara:strand:+ start:34 stop:777 length:744 start_codon:yes stop_codon:yes gene_type:complete
MKYTIYINQKELSKTDFDLVDGAILNYLNLICNSKNEKIDKQRINGYTWVDYNKLLNDNPLMRIKSKGALSIRFKKIEDSGFIKSIERRKNGHKQKYFILTEKTVSLFINTNNPIHVKENPIHLKSDPIHLNSKPIHVKEPISDIKDNTNKYNTIKYERALSFLKPTIDDINEYCKERNNNINAETFFDFYESKDWLIGNNKMNNWKASIRTWEKREKNKPKTMSKIQQHLQKNINVKEKLLKQLKQ